ncbi:MAG: PAS domain S-box protein [Actinobacteria bacterium]|nr:MAG: PAS domain S-box protein [Actinomycetota bacterium]
MSTRRFAQPWLLGIACAALAAAVVLPFTASPYAPPELLTALALVIGGLAGFLAGPLLGLVAVLAGLGSVAVVVDRPGRVALALPVGAAMALAAGLLGARFRRREQERALALTELSAIRETAAEAIVDLDRDGAITSWSPGAEAIYGYSADDVEGRPLSALAEEERVAEIGDLLEQVRDGTTVRRDIVQRRADGETFLASLTVAPLGNGSGEAGGAVAVAADIGERARAQQNAKEADSKYQTLVMRLPLVTYLYAALDRSTPIYVSPQLEALLGYTPDEWLAQGDLRSRLLHPDDRERVLRETAKSARDDAPLRSDYRMLARDGHVVWVRDEASTVRDEEGNPAYIQGYLLDISEQKLGTEELERVQEAEREALARAADREGRLNFLARSTDALAASHDYGQALRQVAELAVRRFADWCIFDISDETGALSRHLVAHAEPIPAGRAAEGAPDENPDKVARRVVARRRAEIVPAPGSAPTTIPSVSGIEAESYMCLPLLVRERVVGAVTIISTTPGRRFTAGDLGLVRDLARRVALAIDNARLYAEVEERAEAARVLTFVADGVFLLDRPGVIQLWNPAAEAMTGLAASSVLHRPATDVLPHWQEIAERIPIESAPDPGHEETVPFETPNGERWFSMVGVNFFGGTVYAFRDVTEARRLDELKAEFVATASHELRTPLAAVYGAAQTLRRHDFALDEAGRGRFISMITDESERLSRIVNEILLASQLDAGRLDLESEPFDPAELVERVVEATRAHLPATVTLGVALPEEPPPSVAADRDKARQVLVNFVENAIKYSPDGGHVEVGIDHAEDAVRFYVSDEGLGIPEVEQDRIFDKFYRLDPEMTRGVGGTGLGLYICSELVRRMSGRIWVQSDHGEGSTFSFELPIAELPLPTVLGPEPQEAPASGPR